MRQLLPGGSLARATLWEVRRRLRGWLSCCWPSLPANGCSMSRWQHASLDCRNRLLGAAGQEAILMILPGIFSSFAGWLAACCCVHSVGCPLCTPYAATWWVLATATMLLLSAVKAIAVMGGCGSAIGGRECTSLVVLRLSMYTRCRTTAASQLQHVPSQQAGGLMEKHQYKFKAKAGTGRFVQPTKQVLVHTMTDNECQ